MLCPLRICVLCVLCSHRPFCAPLLYFGGLRAERKGSGRIWGSYALSRSQSLLSPSFRVFSGSWFPHLKKWDYQFLPLSHKSSVTLALPAAQVVFIQDSKCWVCCRPSGQCSLKLSPPGQSFQLSLRNDCCSDRSSFFPLSAVWLLPVCPPLPSLAITQVVGSLLFAPVFESDCGLRCPGH